MEAVESMNDSEQDIWLRRFDQENVQVIVLSLRDDDDLVKTLRRQPGWLIDFEGDGAVIFTRSKGAGNWVAAPESSLSASRLAWRASSPQTSPRR
jgi:hypothetical protein